MLELPPAVVSPAEFNNVKTTYKVEPSGIVPAPLTKVNPTAGGGVTVLFAGMRWICTWTSGVGN